MAITVGNVQTSDGLTISSYAVPAGNDKILVVTTGNENSSEALVTAITHNGVNLTFRKRLVRAVPFTNTAELWDIQLGSSTPTGDIVVTLSTPASSSTVAAMTIIGVAQQTPEASSSAGSTGTSINTAITTVTPGALIVDGLSHGEANIPSVTQGPDQVLDAAFTAFSISQGMSHRIGGAAGSFTLGWSVASSQRLAHVLVAYKEAVGGVTTRRYSLGLTGVG